MELPVNPPIEPMLAKAVTEVPQEPGLYYEPKWDGFRCLVFRDGDEVVLDSRGGKELGRYFPDVIAAVKAELPQRCVLDGELIAIVGDQLDFETLQQRIHPAASRINLLAEQTPADFVAFDLLALDDESFMEAPYEQRRRILSDELPAMSTNHVGDHRIHVTPVTTDFAMAQEWFTIFEGAGLDGLVCKSADLLYLPGKRVMTKVKHERTVDAVVAGFRWYKRSKPGTAVGSLLLGLYNDSGQLQHVGVTGSFTAERRVELISELAPYRMRSIKGHPWADWAQQDQPTDNDAGLYAEPARMPGAPSRWGANKDSSWLPLRPELVIEVRFDHMEGPRFRHTTQFVRWRPDRKPESCTYEQLERPVRFDLSQVLRGKP